MAQQESANEIAYVADDSSSSPPNHAGISSRTAAWFRQEGPWWSCSFLFHLILVCSLALMGGKVVEKVVDRAPSFEEATIERPVEAPQEVEHFELGDTPIEPSELNTETLSLEKPAQLAQEEKHYDQSSTFSDKGGGITTPGGQPNLGGLGGFDIKSVTAGPAVRGKGGVGAGIGTGIHPGTGGDALGFGGRGAGSRQALLASGGGTRQSERAVAGALNWIARHQAADGSWSLTTYKARCKDGTCTGDAKAGAYDTAATALGLLPFLGAGQTHESKGRYKRNIQAGIAFLIANQKPNGDLRMGTTMYAHGLAALALCECYGMTGDKVVRRAAQAALNFIMAAQDPIGGGWRYEPQEPGDTSVTGWQMMALKSGEMAYLTVDPTVFEKARAFLKLASTGPGRFSYLPGGKQLKNEARAVTAVGLLCQQYLRVPRTDPAMVAGTALLMQNQPDPSHRNTYYWYYATQMMHNQPGPDWDAWNRKIRRILIETQCRSGNCAEGSWDPSAPQIDAWGPDGGRLMMTSLSALTLEVYYRYLPLYKLDSQAAAVEGPGTGKVVK